MTFLIESYTGYWPVSDMAEGYREMAEINLELANAYWPLTQVALEGET